MYNLLLNTITCIDQDDVSVLGYVVFSGNIEAVRYLLDLGVDVLTCLPEVRYVFHTYMYEKRVWLFLKHCVIHKNSSICYVGKDFSRQITVFHFSMIGT